MAPPDVAMLTPGREREQRVVEGDGAQRRGAAELPESAMVPLPASRVSACCPAAAPSIFRRWRWRRPATAPPAVVSMVAVLAPPPLCSSIAPVSDTAPLAVTMAAPGPSASVAPARVTAPSAVPPPRRGGERDGAAGAGAERQRLIAAHAAIDRAGEVMSAPAPCPAAWYR